MGVCSVFEDGDDPERVGEVFPAGQGIRGQTDPDFAHTAGDRAGRFESPVDLGAKLAAVLDLGEVVRQCGADDASAGGVGQLSRAWAFVTS
ncbi:hypothetical protein [Amycolatopsis sp. Poz14]|uniref:hypothetical protein n=1 Tax=Amycolatopsis sp. Poz14 TaxID=1447705 RepID=UPI001EE91366|nr:hypothetical protein [Amycolatopsis sp. Poz14]MCG3756449.1 hypothetical protein [Amycolatopsis sp. Poz14]